MTLSHSPRSWRSAMARILATLAVAISLVAASIAPTFAAGGQSGGVTGVVQDNAGKPIQGAKATLASPSGTYTQTTDANGAFGFLGIPVDTYTISIEAKGFEPLGQPGITVEGGGTNSLGTVKLNRTNVPREIGRVTARSQSSAFQPNQTVPQFTVSGQTLLAAQGKAADANENEVLLAVPGFQLDAMGGLILQGSLIDQVRYQFDGVDFTDPAFNRNVNNNFFNAIGTVQVVPGAGDPSQGNAGAGVVNLVVKRGTYPGTGLFDVEADAKPFSHQLNLSYGLASPNGRFSDYFSFFGTRNAFQYGAFGSTAAENNALYNNQFSAQNDFVNNFVYRFGKNNSQSLQFLYLNDSIEGLGNYGNLALPYPAGDPVISTFFTPFTASANAPNGLTTAEWQSILGFDQGQTSQTQTLNSNINNLANTSLLKFEYDNQLNSSTYLAVRYFKQSEFADADTDPTIEGFAPVLRTEQTSGGSRVGGNFELQKQLNEQNLLTFSGSYEFNRPDFSSDEPYVGLLDLQGNAQDFLRPANPNLPVSASNPCPVAGGCYLQQFFFQKGGTPLVPPLSLSSIELQNNYGVGLRDQIQATQRLRFDVGLRYDIINQGFGPNLFYADENTQPVPGSPATPFISNYGFVENPHFLQPRLGLSYRIDDNDSFQFSYGRAIISQGSGELASPESQTAYAAFDKIPANPNFAGAGDLFIGYPPTGFSNCFPFLPFPVGAGPNAQPSYKGSIGTTLQFGKQCANYGQELYAANDAFFPEVSAVQPGVFNEYDLNLSHQFKNGSALKIAPFFREGADVQAISANLIDINGTFQPGTLQNSSVGFSRTSGVSLEYTLPEHPYGLTGFLSASYVNEFTNTPPGSDNPNAQDFEPLITPQSLASGNLYRAGFVSPFTLTAGANYKFHNGLRINPVLNFNVGYPYGVGLLEPSIYNGKGINVPGTNVTSQYGANASSQFVDPANPGSIFAPVIAATRGTPENSSAGGQLTTPNLSGNLTIEYTPPHTRSTFGVQVLNLFTDLYAVQPSATALVLNGQYIPVTTGVAAPLTGQNPNNTVAPNEAPLRPTAQIPSLPYLLGVSNPTVYRLYYQLAL